MIAYLMGTVAGTDQASAIIDVNGIGYSVFMSNRALSRLPRTGEQVRVFTHLQVREDDMSLYGFLTLEEKDLFTKLIGVTGVGPKVALAALATFEPNELVEAIIAEDVKAVSRIPGVGKKSASRIVLELKGSLDSGFGQSAAPTRENANMKLAAETLMAMGFSPTEAEVALRDAPADATEAALVKYALKQIGS
ncbi:MAG: Holliday junction branch migration protein RuvA [Coriobacteriia bacterium]|nr:Holliday junction branch migration protein RuvA [Coriobacteriia bacterium]